MAPRKTPFEPGSACSAGPPVIATFFSDSRVGKADPLAVGRDERAGGCAEAGQRRRVELVERPHEERRAVGTDIDDARAVGRDRDVRDSAAAIDWCVSAAALGGVISKRVRRGAAAGWQGSRATRWRPRGLRRPARHRHASPRAARGRAAVRWPPPQGSRSQVERGSSAR